MLKFSFKKAIFYGALLSGNVESLQVLLVLLIPIAGFLQSKSRLVRHAI